MTALFSLVLVATLSGTAADDAVLVQFTSRQCSHCQTMQPIVQRIADEGCPVQVIDVDQHPDVAQQFRVTGVPTYVALNRGNETGRVVGATSYDRLVQLYRGAAGANPGSAAAEQSVAAVSQPNLSPPVAQASTPPAAPPAVAQPTEFRTEPEAAATFTSAAAAAATPSAATANLAAEQAAMAATVRLKVEDAGGYGFGTGTIIDLHGSEALVVTCGHIFRESQGQGKVLVDLFAAGASEPVEGQVIAYDLDRDVALVSIRPNVTVKPVLVAPPGASVRPNDKVFSIGCDKGADPTVRQSHITAVNKYQGRPNYTSAGAPIDGRSGGGLFSADGRLIGICNAADPADDEGLYAALASIHWQLDQIGQSEIYQRAAKPASEPAKASIEEFSSVPAAEASVPSLPSAMPGRPLELAATADGAISNGATTNSATVTPASYNAPAVQPATPSAGELSPVAAGDDTEIVFIVRSKANPQQQSEVFVVDQAPPDLLARITHAAQSTGQRRAAAIAASRMAPAASSSAGQPLEQAAVVRGQSSDY
jgi:S1-C subfamily serine protease